MEDALRIDPGYVHAHWDRTQYLFYGKRDFTAAVKAAEALLAVVPQGPDAESVRKLMAEARRQGAGRAPLSRRRADIGAILGAWRIPWTSSTW